MNADSLTWNELSGAFAFIGNSLLAPMNQTDRLGLDPAFWREFPDFEDEGVAKAIGSCFDYADVRRSLADAGEDPVRGISVEYTRLFVGPPSPVAAPWETFYRNKDVSVGFGEATFEMQRLLREAGLQVSNENNQYADHIGIELLYLSVLCERAAKGAEGEAAACSSFASEHPLSWIARLSQRVSEESPAGYYRLILQVAESLLQVVVQ
ncbi:MAG: molecular chaperone TorD family protein [Eggerthellaceae bacterium]|nr:molecular chaperone TorD family protein [Eggerthellaceae bacterium]